MTVDTMQNQYEYLSAGIRVFSDIYDLTYNLLNTLDLSIDNNGVIIKREDRQPLLYHGCRLKATTNPNIPCYAGQGEAMFDILNNIRLVTTLLGAVITKEANEGGFVCLSHWIEDIKDTKLTAISIKDIQYNVITTRYYNNKCLKFVDAMFLICGEAVDLSNFDYVEG